MIGNDRLNFKNKFYELIKKNFDFMLLGRDVLGLIDRL